MDQLREAAAKVASVMDAEIEIQPDECLVKKKRTLNINAEKSCFVCSLELGISFNKFKKDGTACNKADIFLLPEELPAFIHAWTEHEIPLPANYRQRCEINPNIVCIYLETTERPEDFACRLAAALDGLEQEDHDNYIPKLIN